jgi:hypothetical protein
VVDDISIEGLREILRAEGVSFQRMKTWKRSRDPDYAVKKARVEHRAARQQARRIRLASSRNKANDGGHGTSPD